MEYVYDGQQRVTQVKRYPVNGGAEDTCQQVNHSYDANPYGSSVNVMGRLAAVQWGHETACSQGRFTEMYGYTAAGLATAKTLRLSLMDGHQTFVHDIELTASYGYNNEGKLTSMGQPGYYTGPPGAAQWTNGEQYTWSYDVENRLVQAVLGGVESYGYGPDNKRVWRTKASGDTEFYFYGLGGERQGIYRVGVVNGFNGVKGFFRVTAESVIPKGMLCGFRRRWHIHVKWRWRLPVTSGAPTLPHPHPPPTAAVRSRVSLSVRAPIAPGYSAR